MHFIMSLRIPTSRTCFSAMLLCGLSAIPSSVLAEPCGPHNDSRCQFSESSEMDTEKFIKEVADELEAHFSNAKGYALSVSGDRKSGIASVARGAADVQRGRAFSATGTLSGIGSVSKLLTEMAVNKSIEINNRASGFSQCRVYLHSEVFDVLPPVFRRVVHPGYRHMSIGQVLRHKAGLARCNIGMGRAHVGDPGTWKWDYYKLLSSGPNPSSNVLSCQQCQVGSSCYNNDNYVLATMLLPMIRYGCDAKKNNMLSEIERRCRGRAQGWSKDFCEIQTSFDILGVEANKIVHDMAVYEGALGVATCDPFSYDTDAVAKQYENVMSSHPGKISEEQYPAKRGCGVGGWFMSAHALAQVLHRAWYGEHFVKPYTRATFQTEHDGQAANYSAYATKFGDGLTAAFLSNSSVNGPLVKSIVKRAYQNARFPRPKSGDSSKVRDVFAGTSWNCVGRGSSSNKIELRVPKYEEWLTGIVWDEFWFLGAEERWIVDSDQNGVMKGVYNYFKLGERPFHSPSRWGHFSASVSLLSGLKLGLTLNRTDDGSGWSENYDCTRAW